MSRTQQRADSRTHYPLPPPAGWSSSPARLLPLFLPATLLVLPAHFHCVKMNAPSATGQPILVCSAHDVRGSARLTCILLQGLPRMTFIAIVAGAGGGVVLLSVMIITWCCICRRRRHQQRQRAPLDLMEKPRGDSSDTFVQPFSTKGPARKELVVQIPMHISGRSSPLERARTSSNPSPFISRPLAPSSQSYPSPKKAAPAPISISFSSASYAQVVPGPGPYPTFPKRASVASPPHFRMSLVPPPLASPPHFRASLIPPPTPGSAAPALPRRSSKRLQDLARRRRSSVGSASVYSVASAPWDMHDTLLSHSFSALASAPALTTRFTRPASPADTFASLDADGPEYSPRARESMIKRPW
jgi:hypothetical protein